MFDRLVANDPGVGKLGLAFVRRDLPYVRPEEGIALCRRPDTFMKLQIIQKMSWGLSSRVVKGITVNRI